MQCILIFLDAMHFNILRQSGRSVYAYFKIYFYMPNFASIGRVDLVSYTSDIKFDHYLSSSEDGETFHAFIIVYDYFHKLYG